MGVYICVLMCVWLCVCGCMWLCVWCANVCVCLVCYVSHTCTTIYTLAHKHIHPHTLYIHIHMFIHTHTHAYTLIYIKLSTIQFKSKDLINIANSSIYIISSGSIMTKA